MLRVESSGLSLVAPMSGQGSLAGRLEALKYYFERRSQQHFEFGHAFYSFLLLVPMELYFAAGREK